MIDPERIRFKPALFAAVPLLLLAALWFTRVWIAGFAAETWLRSHGVQARVDVSRLDFGGMDASVRLGDPDRPDFSAQRISLGFAPHGWFAMQSLDVERPFLRVRYDGKKISFGQLQKLIDRMMPQSAAAPETQTKQAVPEATGKPALAINIDNALVQVDAPEGSMKISGQAALRGTELETLNAHIEPATLSGANFRADLLSGGVQAAQTPEGLHLTARFAGSGTAAKLDLDNADIAIDARNVRWSRTESGLRFTGNIATRISAARAAFGDYAFDNLQAAVNASGSAGADAPLDLRFSSSTSGDAAGDTAQKIAASIPLDDARTKRAMVAALQSLHVDISGHVTRANGQTTLALDKPASLTGGNGAVLTLSPGEGALLTANETGIAGAANATLKGRGLPAIALELPSYVMHDDGSFSARTALDARFTALGLRGAHIVSGGEIARANGTITYRPDACARIAASAVMQKGKASLERLRAQLCPVPNDNLLTLAKGAWSVNARLRGTSAELASAQTAISNAAARVQIETDKAGAMNGSIHIASADIRDLSKSPHFKPLSASGNLRFADDGVKGSIALESGKQKLATIALVHSLKSGKGHAEIEANGIDFKPGSFQPADISPLLAQLARADGSANFHGRIAWTKRGMTSGGELDVDGLDFSTPLGAASGATTHVVFTSLVPLQTAPDQKIAISQIGWVTPLTNASAEFEIDPGTLRVRQAGTDIAQGRVTLDPMNVPLASDKTFTGAVRLANVDLGAIVAASNLADKISIKVHIEGAVPFSVGPEGLRLTDGSVESLAPGELSIKRSLWTSGDDSGGKSNAIRDFAFQALEHLAVEKMSGKVESQPGGRLRLVLRIKGYNNPPRPVETRVDVISLWNGTAFDKPLPLPSKTPVDLTLDTSLNFDELLRAYRNAWQADQAGNTGAQP